MVFLLVLREGVEEAFLKECKAANPPFPTRVMNKILRRYRYEWEGWCCKNIPNTVSYQRRTRVENTNGLVVFLLVLGEGVEGAFLKDCQATNL